MTVRWKFFSLVLCFFVCPYLAQAQEDRSVVSSYRTTDAPTIDGSFESGEWDAAGPWIEVTAESFGARFDNGIEEDVFGGPSDLSYRFRTMWMEPWMVYFAYEVTDDIAMDSDPRNLWERDQIEHFMDGDNLEGSTELETFQWWDNDEIFGKFGVSRFTTFEGNSGIMSDTIDDIFFVDFGNFVASAAQAQETGDAATYRVEYAISLEAMWFFGTFIDTPADDEIQIVQDSTVVKFTVSLSDDDNFDTGETERSSTLTYWRSSTDGTDDDPDWRNSAAFADLTFVGEFTDVSNWPVY